MHWLEDPRQGLASFESIEPNDPSALEAAVRALKYYGVLEPGDWRRREEVRFLPDRRSRRARALVDGTSFPILPRPLRPAGLARRLAASSARARASWQADPNTPSFALLGRSPQSKARDHGIELVRRSGPESPLFTRLRRDRLRRIRRRGCSAYLMGVAAECDLSASPGSRLGTSDKLARPDRSRQRHTFPTSPSRSRERCQRRSSTIASCCTLRPDSYWGHYRAAAACYALGSFAEAAMHLDRCLAMRPNNSAIRGYRAACLAWLERYSEALDECDKAVSAVLPMSPSWFEPVRSSELPPAKRGGLDCGPSAFRAAGPFLAASIPESFVQARTRSNPNCHRRTSIRDVRTLLGGVDRPSRFWS